LIARSSTEKARLFEPLGSLCAGRHRLRFLKRVNRSRVQAAAVTHQISCDRDHVSMIALGALKCADIEAGWPSSTRPKCILALQF